MRGLFAVAIYCAIAITGCAVVEIAAAHIGMKMVFKYDLLQRKLVGLTGKILRREVL